MELKDNITSIKGIGEKTSKYFNKLGIYTVGDLLNTYPRDYVSYEEPSSIASLSDGQRATIYAKIVTYVEVKKVRNLTLTTFSVSDGSASMKITYYNSPFLRNVFRKGDSYVFVGNVKMNKYARSMDMPEYFNYSKYESMMQTMQPVYPLTSGLSNKVFQKTVLEATDAISKIEEVLPENLISSYGLMKRSEAVRNMHFPLNTETLKSAIKRMAFDEFFSFLLEVRHLKEENVEAVNSFVVTEEAKAEVLRFKAGLPYTLTKGQSAAVDDIYNDMSGSSVMNRLIQGDVGSGKTIVAAMALMLAVKSGFQGALMVPTEVLAFQHYEDFIRMFKDYDINIALLTGKTSAKDKRHIYEKLKTKEIDIVIGTHALISEKVEYNSLGLVITDEQHRFGVNQRKTFKEKGMEPHVLIMSATPIPRTLAIIMYADLDISIISELPAGRKPIKNCVVGTEYRDTAYNFIKSQVDAGHQAYVICPMVSENELVDAENVVDYAAKLKEVLGHPGEDDEYVTFLHGKMKESEKGEILQRYIEGRIKVLVSTTVIEVGINNPNSTVMMIENAERFGLAQLHQLRGRVGRGDAQSFCIFINAKKSKESMERLKVLEESNDGFKIAADDLKLRGPGDFFGIRQSGDLLFNIADIYNHADMLKLAQTAVIEYGDKVDYNKLRTGINLDGDTIL